MPRMTELDTPKLVIATLLGVVGIAIGTMAWLSIPIGTDVMVKVLVGVFVLACIGPAISIYFNWRAGLALSVVVALGAVLGLQVTLNKPEDVIQVIE